MKQSWESGESDATEADAHMREAVELDSGLESWYRDLPPEWSYKAEPITTTNRSPWIESLFSLPGAPKTMRQHFSPFGALCCQLYHVVRLHLNLTMIDELISVYQIQHLHSATIENLSFQVLAQVDAIMECVPSTLGISPSGSPGEPQTGNDVQGMNGFDVMWPLISVLKCFRRETIRATDKEGRGRWIKHVLEFLGRELGIKKAQAYASLFEDVYGAASV